MPDLPVNARIKKAWNEHYAKDNADGIAARKHIRAAWRGLETVIFDYGRPLTVQELDAYSWRLGLIADRMKRAAAAVRRVKRRRERLVRMGLLRD